MEEATSKGGLSRFSVSLSNKQTDRKLLINNDQGSNQFKNYITLLFNNIFHCNGDFVYYRGMDNIVANHPVYRYFFFINILLCYVIFKYPHKMEICQQVATLTTVHLHQLTYQQSVKFPEATMDRFQKNGNRDSDCLKGVIVKLISLNNLKQKVFRCIFLSYDKQKTF